MNDITFERLEKIRNCNNFNIHYINNLFIAKNLRFYV